MYFFNLRNTERGRERGSERLKPDPLVHFLDACNSQAWVNSKPEAQNSIVISHIADGAHLLEPSPVISPGYTVIETWDEEGSQKSSLGTLLQGGSVSSSASHGGPSTHSKLFEC